MKNFPKIYCKTVLMPIEVTVGDFCWDSDRLCPHFDNEGGHPHCHLKFWPIERDEVGSIPKPEACLNLKEEK